MATRMFFSLTRSHALVSALRLCSTILCLSTVDKLQVTQEPLMRALCTSPGSKLGPPVPPPPPPLLSQSKYAELMNFHLMAMVGTRGEMGQLATQQTAVLAAAARDVPQQPRSDVDARVELSQEQVALAPAQLWQCEFMMSQLFDHQAWRVHADGSIRLGAHGCLGTTPEGNLTFGTCALPPTAAQRWTVGKPQAVTQIQQGNRCLTPTAAGPNASSLMMKGCDGSPSWRYSTTVNQPTFTNIRTGLCLDHGSMSVSPLPPASKRSNFSGVERLWAISPRGNRLPTEEYIVELFAFLRTPVRMSATARVHESPTVFVRPMAGTGSDMWTPVEVPPNPSGRHTWRLQLPHNDTRSDFEWYAMLRGLVFPAGGSDAPVTVVVL